MLKIFVLLYSAHVLLECSCTVRQSLFGGATGTVVHFCVVRPCVRDICG